MPKPQDIAGRGARAVARGAWAEWLLGSTASLPAWRRWQLLLACTLLSFGWSVFHGGNLMVAWGLPDVEFYVRMAHGHFEQVPAPFSARPLAPLLARGIAAVAHCWVEGGFAALAYVSLLWSLAVVFWLLMRAGTPRWLLFAVAAAPFWPQLLLYAGLPDPLYTALLATLLLALERDWDHVTAFLLLPLMLARESTSLLLACLLLARWRRLRWSGSLLAVLWGAIGALLVRYLSRGSLPNPEHLSGGVYMLGKLLSNSLRSVGVMPWSNVYPALCATPAWQTALHFGPVRAVGFCSWQAVGPLQAMWALCTTFGALLALSPVVVRERRVLLASHDGVVRFAALYGGLSLLLAPALGTWYARLFGYAWPLLLVAVPRLVTRWLASRQAAPETSDVGPISIAWLPVHLTLCVVANLFATPPVVAVATVLQGIAFALFLRQAQARPVRSSSGVPA